MRPPPQTAAIVLHWQRVDLTRSCVESLAVSRPAPHVLVVDNGSNVDLLESLRGVAAHLDILSLPANTGFTGGMNAGMRWALDRGFDLIWLLNDDVRVAPDAHAALVAQASRQQDGVWTPRLVDATGRDGHIGGAVSLDGSPLVLAEASRFGALPETARWISATAPLFRASSLRTVGLFDERFFAYWEDVDWCVRAQRAGVPRVVASGAAVVHGPSDPPAAWTAGKVFLTCRNEFVFARKHVAPTDWGRVLPRIAARQLRLAGWLERRTEPRLARAALSGGLSGLHGRDGAPRHAWLSESCATGLLSQSLRLGEWLDRFERDDRSAAADPE